MEKQSYENSRGITLGITTFGAKCFSPEASCRSHTLETIWILCKTRQEWQFPSQRLRFFSSAPRFREQGRNQMGLLQCLLSLHMFRNRYWPCTHAYNKTETRIFCFLFLFRPRSPLTETAWDLSMRLQQQQERWARQRRCTFIACVYARFQPRIFIFLDQR